MTETPVHRRSIEFDVYDGEDTLKVVGRLRDVRPWAAGTTAVENLHDMELRVTLTKSGLVITDAEAVMSTFPHAECPTIIGAFRDLIGLSIARGYTREVQDRFGRESGCAHLETLARAMGPVVVQSVASSVARTVLGGASVELSSGSFGKFLLNTCHIWAEDGVAVHKLQSGWRPGDGGYPAPPLEEIRRRVPGR